MKNYTVSSSILSLVKECMFFNEGSGVKSLPLSCVHETKVKNKFIYSITGSEGDKINHIHEALNRSLFSRIPVNQSATAYVKNKTYLNFLEPHRNHYHYLRVDLKNFFHFISDKIVRESLKEHVSTSNISETCSQSHLDLVTSLVTYTLPKSAKNTDFVGRSILPIGFKTSPLISNIVFRKLDILIEKFCSEHNITYTRYADDMLFSSSTMRDGKYREKTPFDGVLGIKDKKPFVHSQRFIEQLSFIINIDGYKINRRKTIKKSGYISINGYFIEGSNYPYIIGELRVSNKKTKVVSKLIYECSTDKSDREILKAVFNVDVEKLKFRFNPKDSFKDEYSKSQINNKLIGYRSYLISLIKFNDCTQSMNKDFINKCSKLISDIELIINRRM
ncbi:RNA-directed DNA polymerase [Vibrio sp. JPW-9-11-11]|uniref:reverse transcriptase family protein n=1 Tax=Vibrio sp. JPW-9-11-11 TaxID=1416532 RepID=UPI0015930E0F|nr:reverse transcriptase family protein [Vibrio sp. JPW-9-11-11]NVD06786.1 RNA-directed DNA polymerase [Vibrio sp. JPW-9-11-11]